MDMDRFSRNRRNRILAEHQAERERSNDDLIRQLRILDPNLETRLLKRLLAQRAIGRVKWAGGDLMEGAATVAYELMASIEPAEVEQIVRVMWPRWQEEAEWILQQHLEEFAQFREEQRRRLEAMQREQDRIERGKHMPAHLKPKRRTSA